MEKGSSMEKPQTLKRTQRTTLSTTISIQGMHCASCKALIEDVAGDIEGITSCTVDLKNKTAAVEHTEKKNIEELKKEIESLGDYKVVVKS